MPREDSSERTHRQKCPHCLRNMQSERQWKSHVQRCRGTPEPTSTGEFIIILLVTLGLVIAVAMVTVAILEGVPLLV